DPFPRRGRVLRPHRTGLPGPADRRGLAGRPQRPGPQRRGADAGRRLHRPGRGVRPAGGSAMTATAPAPGPSGRWRRSPALGRKESLQILRDPSSYLIAGLLPLLLLVIFGYGISLDLRRIPIGLVVEQASPEADSLVSSFRNSRFFTARLARHRADVEGDLASGRLNGL